MTNAKIKDLEYLVTALKQMQQLKDFKKHMSDSFEELMGDNSTTDTMSEFYESPFVITFRGKSVEIPNGAEVFTDIEYMVNHEIDELQDWIETLAKRF